ADASTQAAHRAIEAVWRLESARIIAGLTGLLRDVGLAEELAQDALVAALEQWTADGITANPGAWLMRTARPPAIHRIRRNDRPARLASVLEVLYLVFNEGYSAMAGDDWMRPALCIEALRLGRVLAGLMPAEPEVHGLVALMEIQASRLAARLSPDGLPVPLLEQNRGRWDQLLIRRGFTALLRAQGLGGTPGPSVLPAAIAAGRARARDA